MKHDDQFSVFWVEFTTLAHKVEALFNNMPEQLLNLLICQLQRKLLSWLAEAHLIADHDHWDLDKLSWFYERLDRSYHDVASDITWCERHRQWINQKASTPPAISPRVARSSEPIRHDPPHCELRRAAVPTRPNGCWRCGEPGHFGKDCPKPQADNPAQIKEVESWLDDQLSCQDFKAWYSSSSDDDGLSEDDLNSSKNLYAL